MLTRNFYIAKQIESKGPLSSTVSTFYQVFSCDIWALDSLQLLGPQVP